MENVIETQGIDFRYDPDDKTSELVLKNISVTISEGELVAILGHNGSGKSTIAKHFNAILLPQGGKVYAMGYDTSDENNLLNIRQNIGMVFQNPDNQIVATIVEEDVAFALENIGTEPAEIRRRVDEALKQVGMYEYREHSPHQLSGGQKQRVAIAGILAMRPRCIVLDEPTAMLDPHGRQEVLSTIKRLNREENVTVVLITHYMDEAAQCGRVIVMNDGSIVFDDAPEIVFSKVEELEAIGLDIPQVTKLVYELQKRGIDLPDGLLTVEQCVDAIMARLK